MGVVRPGEFRATPVYRASRKPGLTRLMLVAGDGVVQDIMVRDFSSKGFSAAARGAPPAANEVVTVLLPDDRALWGIVRWVKGNVFGVEFDVNTPPEAPMKSATPAKR